MREHVERRWISRCYLYRQREYAFRWAASILFFYTTCYIIIVIVFVFFGYNPIFSSWQCKWSFLNKHMQHIVLFIYLIFVILSHAWSIVVIMIWYDAVVWLRYYEWIFSSNSNCVNITMKWRQEKKTPFTNCPLPIRLLFSRALNFGFFNGYQLYDENLRMAHTHTHTHRIWNMNWIKFVFCLVPTKQEKKIFVVEQKKKMALTIGSSTRKRFRFQRKTAAHNQQWWFNFI